LGIGQGIHGVDDDGLDAFYPLVTEAQTLADYGYAEAEAFAAARACGDDCISAGCDIAYGFGLMAVKLDYWRGLILRLGGKVTWRFFVEEALENEILEGISRLKAAIDLDIWAFEDESALGQLFAYPVLDHGVLEALEGLYVHSISITNII